MKKALSLLVIGLLYFSMFSTYAPQAQALSTSSTIDPTDDLYYYMSGSPAPTWGVIDLVYAEISQVDSENIEFLIKASQLIPLTNQWQGYYWLLDTGIPAPPWWNPIDSNDINVAYYVQIAWTATGVLYAEVVNAIEGTAIFYEDFRNDPSKHFSGDTCFITIPLSWVGNPTSIKWVAGSTDGVASSSGRHDKAPNTGHVTLTTGAPVNQPPVADFTYIGPETSFKPHRIYVTSEVKFNAEPSYDPDGVIVSYTWDFGDGTITTATDEVAYHAYLWEGYFTVTLTVTDDESASSEISELIFIHPFKWELFVEIDFMEGHEPTESVLTYIERYYRDNGILLTTFVDDVVSDPTPDDGVITRSDFWNLENQYNDVWVYDDRAFGDVFWKGDFYLKEKWVLYGTFDEKGASGYCSVPQPRMPHHSTRAGNYIYIADEDNDNFASFFAHLGVTAEEAETVILMHELGHSIGILKLVWDWSQLKWVEAYDHEREGGKYTSVMSELSPANCNADPIHYSKAYWNQKDIGYYKI